MFGLNRLAPGGLWAENPPKGLGVLPERPKEKGVVVGKEVELKKDVGLTLLLKNVDWLVLLSPVLLVDVMFKGIVVLAASFFVISMNWW